MNQESRHLAFLLSWSFASFEDSGSWLCALPFFAESSIELCFRFVLFFVCRLFLSARSFVVSDSTNSQWSHFVGFTSWNFSGGSSEGGLGMW